ncbi:MAG: hypothetical protein GY810_04470 [Aureispira sp.]|nr:hypothetical protein [Aureispira sp.]
MFGLMQPEHACGQAKDSNYRHHRMHYCGTCKAIGQQYGQKSRLTLNFDTVFLAELLSHLSNENTQEWGTALQAINKCFTMPKANQKMPFSLKYAATSNILLTELKIKDHIQDHKQKRWKLANWSLSKSFPKAKKQLTDWNINVNQFYDWADQQTELEQAPAPIFDSVEQQLQHYATPTAQMTGLIFQEAAQVLELKHDNIAQKLYQLGLAFGQLAYILDAFDDVEKDIAQGQFNPLVQWYKLDKTLTQEQINTVQNLILELKNFVVEQLQKLTLNEDWIAVYAGRLTSNVATQIYKERKIPITTTEAIKTRWQEAKEKAIQLTCQPNSLGQKLNYYVVSVAVFMAPQAAHPVEPNERAMIWKSLAIFTVMLATLGLAGKFGFGRVPKSRICNCQRACEECMGKLCKLVLFFILLLALLAFLILGIIGLILGPLAMGIVFMSLFVVGLVGAFLWYFNDDDLSNC